MQGAVTRWLQQGIDGFGIPAPGFLVGLMHVPEQGTHAAISHRMPVQHGDGQDLTGGGSKPQFIGMAQDGLAHRAKACGQAEASGQSQDQLGGDAGQQG